MIYAISLFYGSYNLANFLPREYIYASRNQGLPSFYGPIILFIVSSLFFTTLTFLSLYLLFRNVDSAIVRKTIVILSLSFGVFMAYMFPSISLSLLGAFQSFIIIVLIIMLFAVFRLSLIPHKHVNYYSTKLDRMKMEEIMMAIEKLSQLDDATLAELSKGKFKRLEAFLNYLSGSPGGAKLAELARNYRKSLMRAKNEKEIRRLREKFRSLLSLAIIELIKQGKTKDIEKTLEAIMKTLGPVYKFKTRKTKG